MNPPQDDLKKEIENEYTWDYVMIDNATEHNKHLKEAIDKTYILAKSETLKKVFDKLEDFIGSKSHLKMIRDYPNEWIEFRQKLKKLETKE